MAKANDRLAKIQEISKRKTPLFDLVECEDPLCKQCTRNCSICGDKYDFLDKNWLSCRWCKKRQFCGKCYSHASSSGTSHNSQFQYMKMKICLFFQMNCED
ncbi:hypothetical protein G9A89_001386 [Geosiphon pyriformis]|nr:hypothetical protein G9A89_001386 [Geosiphon pyriformis]